MTQAYTTNHQNGAIREAVHAWRGQGVQVVPVTEDGTKRPDALVPVPTTDPVAPVPGWKKHQSTWIREEAINATFADGRTGLVILLGTDFRDDGLKPIVIEIERGDMLDLVRDTAEAAGIGAVAKVLGPGGYLERSGGGGLHAVFLCPVAPKSTALAKRPAPTKENPKAVELLIEVLGPGHAVTIAPSHGAVHPSGNAYETLHGSPDALPVLTSEELTEVLDFLRAFDEMPMKEKRPTVKASTIDGDRPGDRYNDAATLDTVLQLTGASVVKQQPDRTYLQRAGKTTPGVSFTYWHESKQLYVFSTSTSLDADRSYSPFALYAHFEHGDDYRAAAKALYADGYGKRPFTKLKFGEGTKSDDDSGDDAFEGEFANDPDAIAAIALDDTLRVADNRFWSQDGFVPVPLANGVAWITHYETEEIAPGEFQYRYRIKGALADGTQLPSITVPTDDLGNIHHWTGCNGPLWARFTLAPGLAIRDQVRACIKLYSNHRGFDSIQRFSETGWSVVNGDHVFRTHRAAIGRKGVRDDIDVQLPPDFARYTLPTIPGPNELPDLARRYLRIFDLAPDDITAPLVLSHVRAILGEFIPVDNLIYLFGLTGVFKTEVSTLMMAHFGAGFTSRTLPLNFEGTQNSTQAALWRLKDVVSVIDDMAPGGTRNQIDAKYGLLDALGRMAGNRAGRTRSNADMTAKQTFYPRGRVIASGEDLPRGHSASARMTTVEIMAGAIDPAILTECQAMAADGVFSRLTASFIHYIAGHWDELAAGVDRLHAKALVDMRTRPFRHRRTGDAIAPVVVAAQVWFEYLRSIGGISEKDRDTLITRMTKGLIANGEAQDIVQREANPTEIFIASIRSAVLRGDAHVADRLTGKFPQNGERFGWEREVRTTRDGIEPVDRARGAKIGWIDPETDALYLDPDSSYAVAQRLGRDTGRTIPTTVTTLGKRLMDAGMLVSTEAGRVKTKTYVAGTPQRTWHLRLSDVFPPPDDAEDGREPTPFSRRGVA